MLEPADARSPNSCKWEAAVRLLCDYRFPKQSQFKELAFPFSDLSVLPTRLKLRALHFISRPLKLWAAAIVINLSEFALCNCYRNRCFPPIFNFLKQIASFQSFLAVDSNFKFVRELWISHPGRCVCAHTQMLLGKWSTKEEQCIQRYQSPLESSEDGSRQFDATNRRWMILKWCI